MNILLLPCLFFMIITIYLYTISKTNDKYLLGTMIFGQILLLIGSSIKNNILIEVSHIFFYIKYIYRCILFLKKNITNIIYFLQYY